LEDAMSKEIEGLRQAGAIESEEICEDSPPSWDGRHATEVINGLWVNATKRGTDCEVIRCKLRSVANDPKSKREIRSPGLATFSPSVRHSSLKCQIESLCIKEYKTGVKRRYFGLDITQAYLKGESTALEQCHFRPPSGFCTRDHRGVAYVWRLKSPLYGQGDAGRIWCRTLHAQLLKQGFARIHNDPCLYAKYYKDGTSMDITFYVDDMQGRPPMMISM
jgi:hypothetical protein